MLFDETVDQNGQGSEANVVQSQVGCIIEWLKMRKDAMSETLDHLWCLSVLRCACASASLPVVRNHRRTGIEIAGR